MDPIKLAGAERFNTSIAFYKYDPGQPYQVLIKPLQYPWCLFACVEYVSLIRNLRLAVDFWYSQQPMS